MPVLEACPLQLLAKTLDIAELNSRTIRLSAASVLQINVLDISAIITLITWNRGMVFSFSDLEEHPMPNKASHSTRISYIFTSWCAFTYVMPYFTRNRSVSFSCYLEFMLLNKTVGLSLYSEKHTDTKGILKLEKLSHFIWILQLVQ